MSATSNPATNAAVIRDSVFESIVKFTQNRVCTTNFDERKRMLEEFKKTLKNRNVQEILIKIINDPWVMKSCSFQGPSESELDKITKFWETSVRFLCLGVGYKKVRDALVRFVKEQTLYELNHTAHCNAVEALSAFAHEVQVFELLSSIALSNSYIASDAVMALGKVASLNPRLLTSFLRLPNEYYVDQSVTNVFSQCKDQETRSLLVKISQNKDEDVATRIRALTLLETYVGYQGVIECVTEQTFDGDSEIRIAALLTLGKISADCESDSIMISRLEDKHHGVRSAAACALANRAAQEVVYTALVNRLKKENIASVQLANVTSLEKASDHEIVQSALMEIATLIHMQHDLDKARDKSIEILAGYQDNPKVKTMFLEMLGRRIPSYLRNVIAATKARVKTDPDYRAAYQKIKEGPFFAKTGCEEEIRRALT